MTKGGPELIQVITTCGSREDAERLATVLVDARLAACVHVHAPITSVYRWQGQVEQSQEWLCLIKTDEPHYPALEAAIIELHSYDVPEVLALPVSGGSAKYLDWLSASLAK